MAAPSVECASHYTALSATESARERYTDVGVHDDATDDVVRRLGNSRRTRTAADLSAVLNPVNSFDNGHTADVPAYKNAILSPTDRAPTGAVDFGGKLKSVAKTDRLYST